MRLSWLNSMLLIFLIGCSFSSIGQGKKVRLVHADRTVFNKKLVNAQRLVGHVQLNFDGSTFSCDSAYFYENENFQAFGNIRVNKPGEYSISGKKLFFNKANQLATLYENGVFTDGDMTLTAPNMNYNFKSETATFSGGGRIISNRNNNVLTAQTGRYHSPSNQFTFRRKVTVKNNEYTVVSDTMLYNSVKEESFFFGPTTITSSDLKIKCIWGSFNSKTEQCAFTKRATVEQKKFKLVGDSIFFNGASNDGEAFGNVIITDLTDNTVAIGNYGKHIEKTNTNFITNRAYIKKPLEKNDTLFIKADSLFIVGNEETKKNILAYHQVLFYSMDFQGKSDSLIYSESDSSLQMYLQPILWSEQTQLTGSEIQIQLSNNKISSLFIPTQAFLVSEVKKDYFNQIRGSQLKANFKNDQIETAKFSGNSEVLYFPVEEKNNKQKISGRNQATCSEVIILFKENKVSQMSLINEANSTFSPNSVITKLPKTIEGYNPYWDFQPKGKKDIIQSLK
jgi:lipopolysaccharide export system protein LptA